MNETLQNCTYTEQRRKLKQNKYGTYFTVKSGATKRLAAVFKTAPCALLFTSGTNRIILQTRMVNMPMRYTRTNTPPSGHCHVYGK